MRKSTSNLTSTFARGQVWHVADEQFTKTIGSEQRKNRPWLIVSCQENNLNAPILNCIPMSTRAQDNYPMHVCFVDIEGIDRVFMCEQITTKSVERFKLNGSHFMYTICDELMDQVDQALRNQLQIADPVEVSLNKLEKSLNTLFSMKLQNFQRTHDDALRDFMQKITETIESLEISDKEAVTRALQSVSAEVSDQVDQSTNNHSAEDSSTDRQSDDATSSYTTNSQVDPITDTEPSKRRISSVNGIEVTYTPGGSIRWTEDLMLQYLIDSEELSLKQLALKYGLSSTRTAASNKYRFKAKLNEE